MIEFLKFITNIVNFAHDEIVALFTAWGLTLTDKQLHFIVIGVFGLCVMGCIHLLFKVLSKLSIESISFVYTFTVLLVVVFAIEIQQKITNRGIMEFDDAAYGIYGFLAMYFGWLGVKWVVKITIKCIEFLKKIDF